MKSRRWILYIALVALVFGTGIFVAKKVLRKHRYFERFLTERIYSITGQRIEVDGAELKPGAVVITGLQLQIADIPGKVTVDRVDIRYNLVKLLYSGFNITKALTHLVVDHPVVFLKSRPVLHSSENSGEIPPELNVRVIVSRGEFRVAGKDTSIALCSELDLFGHIYKGGITGVRCDAQVMSAAGAEKNFSFTATYNHQQKGAWKTELSIAQAVIPDAIRWSAFFPRVRAINGALNLNLKCQRAESTAALVCNGSIHYAGESIRIKHVPQRIKKPEITLTFNGEGGVARIDAKYRGTAAAHIKGRFNWSEEGIYTTSDVILRGIGTRELYDFAPFLKDNLTVRNATVRARVNGLLSDLEAGGTVRADTLDIRGYRIGNILGNMMYRDGRFTIQQLTGQNNHSSASLDGSINLKDAGRVDLTLSFAEDSLAMLADALLPFGIEGNGAVSLLLRGHPDSLQYSGGFNLGRIAIEDRVRLQQVEGSYTFKEGVLNFASRMKDNAYHLEGMLSSVDDTVQIFTRLRMHKVALDTLATMFGVERPGLPGYINAFLEISGKGDVFVLKGHGNLIDHPVISGGFILDGSISTGATGIMLHTGVAVSGMKLNGKPIEASCVVDASPEEIALTEADIAGILTGSCVLNLHDAMTLDGQFEVAPSAIATLGQYVLKGEFPDVVDGIIEGRILLSGDAMIPVVNADLTITGGRLYRQRNLNGIAAFTVKGKDVALDNIKVFSGRDELLMIEGAVGMDGAFDLNLSGSNVAAENLIRCTPLKTMSLEGKLDYVLSVAGTHTNPYIRIACKGRDGNIGTVGFSEMHMDVSWEDEIVSIDELMFAQGDDYTIDISGAFTSDIAGVASDRHNAEAALKVLVEGNLLLLIPNHELLMKRALSTGSLTAQLGRNADTFMLEDLTMRIADAEILFAGYPVPIQNLNGSFQLDSSGHFIAIEQLHGSLGENKFSLQNKPTITTVDGELSPFMITGTDVSLGIFLFDFGRGTRQIYIPGLMASNERMAAAIRGRTTREKFMLAGPNAHPRLRGEVGINDVDITFPFLIEEDAAGNAQQVLEQLQWDLRLVAEKKVRYYVAIDLLDRFDTEMEVEEGGILDIQGALYDSSFYLQGVLETGAGRMHYLGETFDVNQFEIAFDRYHEFPAVRGEGQRLLQNSFGDSLASRERILYLRPYMDDEETGEKIYRARWNRMKLEVSSNFSNNNSFGEFAIFDTTSITEKAMDAIGIGVQSYLIRPYMRPLEKQLEKWSGDFSQWLQMRDFFKIDMIRLDPVIGNIFSSESEDLLRRSNFTLGKSLNRSMFLTYTGYFDMMPDAAQESGTGLGLQEHRVGLQFKLMRNLRVEYEYDYRIDSVDPHRQGLNLKYFWYLDRDKGK